MMHLVATSVDHGQRLESDMEALLKKVLSENPSLSPEEAMLQVQETLLKDNPFVPPKDGRCVINTLPAEILAHIFRMGVYIDRYDDDDDDEFQEVEGEEEKNSLQQELRKKDVVVEELGEVEEDDGNDEDWEDEPSSDHEHDECGSSCSDNDDSDDAEESEEDEDEDVPFELLASHVCRLWRDTALSTPDLWNSIQIIAPPQWERYEAYLERAKGQPLTIDINGTREDEEPHDHPDHPGYIKCDDDGRSIAPGFFSPKELERIVDMMIPYANQWYQVNIDTEDHGDMEMVLKRFHEIPEAPILEYLHLQDVEMCGDDPVNESELQDLTLPFHGKAPNLHTVDLLGVHLDWDGAITLFQGLTELSLAFHIKRPSFQTFATYLRNSPNLKYLELDESGPALLETTLVGVPDTPATSISTAYYTPTTCTEAGPVEQDRWEWPRYPLEVPSVSELSLSGHPPHYATALATKFFFPNIKSLTLNCGGDEYTETVKAYTNPVCGASNRRSTFQLLQSLTLVDLGTVRSSAIEDMLGSLVSLRSLSLRLDYDDEGSVPERVWLLLLENGQALRALARDGEAKTVVSSATPTAASQPLAIIPPSPSATLPPRLATEPGMVHCKLLLPRLATLQTWDIAGSDLRHFVQFRKSVGAPLKSVMVESSSPVTGKDERWLRDNLEHFSYFDDSDEEEDDEEDDDMDMDIGADEEEGISDEDEDDEDEDEDGWEDEDEDEDEWEDEDEVDRVRAHNVPHASGLGAVGNHVTTGLGNLD